MMQGVLRLPPEIWTDSPIDIAQRHSRYVEAADTLRLFSILEEKQWNLIYEANDEYPAQWSVKSGDVTIASGVSVQVALKNAFHSSNSD